MPFLIRQGAQCGSGSPENQGTAKDACPGPSLPGHTPTWFLLGTFVPALAGPGSQAPEGFEETLGGQLSAQRLALKAHHLLHPSATPPPVHIAPQGLVPGVQEMEDFEEEETVSTPHPTHPPTHPPILVTSLSRLPWAPPQHPQ